MQCEGTHAFRPGPTTSAPARSHPGRWIRAAAGGLRHRTGDGWYRARQARDIRAWLDPKDDDDCRCGEGALPDSWSPLGWADTAAPDTGYQHTEVTGFVQTPKVSHQGNRT